MSKVALIRGVLLAASATGLAACGGPAPEDANADHAPHCRVLDVDGEARLFCDPTEQDEQALLAAPGSGSCGFGSGWDSCVDNGMGCSATCWSCSPGWGSGSGTGCSSGGGSYPGGGSGSGSTTACEYWPGFSRTASGAANGMDLEATRAQACSNAANNAANACSGYGVLCTSYTASVSTGQGSCFYGQYNVPQQAYSYDCWCTATAQCRYR